MYLEVVEGIVPPPPEIVMPLSEPLAAGPFIQQMFVRFWPRHLENQQSAIQNRNIIDDDDAEIWETRAKWCAVIFSDPKSEK